MTEAPSTALPGQEYGRLTVVAEAPRRGKLRRVVARCACGVVREYYAHAVASGNSRSCGCVHATRPTMDRVGLRFGALEVVAHAGRRGAMPMLRVRCDCGSEKVVQYSNLLNGTTRSCGCAQRARSAAERAAAGARLAALVGARAGTLTVVAAHAAATPRVEPRLDLRCDCGAARTVTRQTFARGLVCRACHPAGRVVRYKHYVALGGVSRPAVHVAREHGVSRQLFEARREKWGWDALAAATTPPTGRRPGPTMRQRRAAAEAR